MEYGFRLPSALDNRPLKFEEFEQVMGHTIYTSATPGPYEMEKADAGGRADHPPDGTGGPRSGSAPDQRPDR